MGKLKLTKAEKKAFATGKTITGETLGEPIQRPFLDGPTIGDAVADATKHGGEQQVPEAVIAAARRAEEKPPARQHQPPKWKKTPGLDEWKADGYFIEQTDDDPVTMRAHDPAGVQIAVCAAADKTARQLLKDAKTACEQHRRGQREPEPKAAKLSVAGALDWVRGAVRWTAETGQRHTEDDGEDLGPVVYAVEPDSDGQWWSQLYTDPVQDLGPPAASLEAAQALCQQHHAGRLECDGPNETPLERTDGSEPPVSVLDKVLDRAVAKAPPLEWSQLRIVGEKGGKGEPGYRAEVPGGEYRVERGKSTRLLQAFWRPTEGKPIELPGEHATLKAAQAEAEQHWQSRLLWLSEDPEAATQLDSTGNYQLMRDRNGDWMAIYCGKLGEKAKELGGGDLDEAKEACQDHFDAGRWTR